MAGKYILAFAQHKDSVGSWMPFPLLLKRFNLMWVWGSCLFLLTAASSVCFLSECLITFFVIRALFSSASFIFLLESGTCEAQQSRQLPRYLATATSYWKTSSLKWTVYMNISLCLDVLDSQVKGKTVVKDDIIPFFFLSSPFHYPQTIIL